MAGTRPRCTLTQPKPSEDVQRSRRRWDSLKTPGRDLPFILCRHDAISTLMPALSASELFFETPCSLELHVVVGDVMTESRLPG